MATYRQTITRYEDGYGDVTVDIVLANSYDNIFTDEYYTIDIIDFKDIDKQNENAIGQLSTDKASFEINEATFKMNDNSTIVADGKTQLEIDIEALDYCLNSVKPNYKYIGVFVNTSETPDFEDAIFIGGVEFDYEEEHLFWNGDDYDDERNPLKSYKFSATPIQEALFDAVSLQSAIDLKSVELKVAANSLPAGYEDGDFSTKIPFLITFDKLIKTITTGYEQALSNHGFGNFNISYSDCTLDGKFHPTRFNKPLADSVIGFIVSYSGYDGLFDADADGYENYMDVYGDDGRTVKLTGGSDVPALDGIYVSLTNIFPVEELDDKDYREEVLKETASKFLWQDNSRVNDSFTNLLYSIATDLGLALTFDFVTQSDIVVNFIPKSEVESTQLYIKNAEKATSKRFTIQERDENKLPKGITSHLSLEGENEIIDNEATPTHTTTPSKRFSEEGSTNKSLMGITAPLWRTTTKVYNSVNEHNQYPLKSNKFVQQTVPSVSIDAINGLCIPYNIIHYDSSESYYSNGVPWNSVSFSSSLYIYAPKRVGEQKAPTNYVTPVGMYKIKKNGTNLDFTTLEDYRKTVNALDVADYGRELSLTVPYLMAFSNASNGSGADIKNLTIGRKVVMDSVEFLVTGYKIDFDKWKVDIKLEKAGRFDYENSSDTSDFSGKLSNIQSTESTAEGGGAYKYTASGIIKSGQLVSLKTSNTVEVSVCSNTHYDRVIGIALNDAADTEGVSVQTSGKVEISSLGGSINDAVFLRDVSSTVNLSRTQLTDKDGTEDYYLEVGKVVGTDVMKIDFKEGFVLP